MTHPTTPQGLLDLVPPEIRDATVALDSDLAWITFIAIIEYGELSIDELIEVTRNPICDPVICQLGRGGLIQQYCSDFRTQDTRRATTVYRPTSIGKALLDGMMNAILRPTPITREPSGGNSYDN